MERSKRHLLQKLFSREIHGSFVRGHTIVHDKAMELFSSIPDRLMFYLKDVLPHMGKHVLVGMTRCGQFLITYSYSTDVRVRLPVRVAYKYRLHWWAFRPGAPAYKVAEVQLFDNQDISYSLTVGIAQWPRVHDKLIVYGYCDDRDAPYEQEEGDSESRKYYITVTTLPSLHNCQDCKAVADSFDEEDLAANWDSCIGLTCLRHGLTIHTTLAIDPPYPSFQLLTNLKLDNRIIVNTANFLHVLSFASNHQTNCPPPSRDDNIQPEDISHKVGEILSNTIKDYVCPWRTQSMNLSSRKTLTRSVNSAWLNTIMDRAEKVYAFEESEDGCEPRFKWYRKRRIADKMYEFCSDEEDMENIRPKAKLFRSELYSRIGRLKDDEELRRKPDIFLSEKPKYFIEPIRTMQMTIEKIRGGQNDLQSKDNVNLTSCDHDTTSNECDNRRLDEPSDNPAASVADSFSDRSNSCDNEQCNTPQSSSSGCVTPPPKIELLNMPPLGVSIINPDLSAILAEWEADSVSSLSPKSDCVLNRGCETKNDVIQSFLERIPGMTLSPRSSSSVCSDPLSPQQSYAAPSFSMRPSPSLLQQAHAAPSTRPSSSPSAKYSPLLVVLRARNCNQDVEPQRTKETDEKCKPLIKEEVTGAARVKPGKEADQVMRQRMISGCSVRFDRIYIEVDEEIISTITDIEDDDQGTGFHCALPLSVHGSAYAQLQMVSSYKAEKMNMHCERVYQTSLDIEQFCFKAADIICRCEGYKFWFCNDYDVEIIDVCAFNGDILGVVCLRINAEKKPSKTERHTVVSQRLFYEVRCVFVWNPGSDRCWLEAYSQLVDVTRHVTASASWAPASQEATCLRNVLRDRTLFTLRPHPNIRAFTHRMWNNDQLLVPSLKEIRDNTNLIGFRLTRVPLLFR